MPENPLVSVVIPTLDREGHLCATLSYFLFREDYAPFEIIIVDQSARHLPVTEAFLRRHSQRFKYLRLSLRNLAAARNAGIKEAKGEIVVFVDDDVKPFLGFLRGHLRPYADSAVSGVSGPVLSSCEKGLKTAEEIGEEAYSDLLKGRGANGRHSRHDVDFSYQPSWSKGANMSFRRKELIKVGLFDETIRSAASNDDAEISQRFFERGLLIHYSPEACLRHYQFKSGGCRYQASGWSYYRDTAFNHGYFLKRRSLPVLERLLEYQRYLRRMEGISLINFVPVASAFAIGVIEAEMKRK